MKNLTKLRKSVITVFAVLIYGIAFSQFTRNQAIELVMNDIVGDDSTKVNVYAAFQSYSQQQDVVLFDNRSLSCPYTDNWVFFIDDNPNYFWNHDCRYIFVSSQNGNYTIVNERLYPAGLETEYEWVSSIPGHEAVTMPEYTGGPVVPENPDDHLFAVLVGGTSQSTFWTDISMIYNTLLEKGYKKENIFVHFSDAGGSYGWQGMYNDDLDGDLVLDDIDYDASLASLQTTFDNLSGVSTSNPEIPKLEHGDQLLIHFDSHGESYDEQNMGSYITVFSNSGGEELYDYELAAWLEPIECAQMIITMQQCRSGGFIDDLTDYTTYPNTMCKNRRIITSARYYEDATMEIHITGGNSAVIGGVYGEFDFYFYSALRGLYPDVNPENDFHPWEPSANLGEFPFYLYPTLVNHSDDYDPDEVWGNDDGTVQVGEGFLYMDDFDTWSPFEYFQPYAGMPNKEHPQNEKTGLFVEDLFTLEGLVGEVENDQTVTGNFLIGGNVTIESSADVNIANASEFYFQDGNCRIYVDGELHLGENNFLKGQDETFMSLLSMNTGGILTVDNGTEFNNMRLEFTGYPIMENLTLNNVTFNTFDINGHIENATISNTDFNHGWVQLNCNTMNISNSNFNYSYAILEAISSSDNLTIDKCIFTNINSLSDAVQIESFPNYTFSNNTIDGYYNGLYLFNSGTGKEAYIVNNNYIHNCTGSAIATYATKAKISNNYIIANGIGVKLMNKSSIELRGNKDAGLCAETQSITNNSSYEVYSTEYSFPYYFKYNCIKDPDNAGGGSDALVYYKQGIIGNILDVRFNCWGDNFDPSEDLYPSSLYIYDPEWCPDGSGTDSDNAAEMYLTAQSQIEQENYNNAKATYISLIEQYPDSKYAKTAMKDLVELEKFVYNDYSSLKTYYETEPAIQNNPTLIKLADFLANRCNIKLANWPDAISWFENVIQNPESVEDSIFAIIDLSYTYWLMENGGMKASSYVGSMPQYKFTDYATFEDNRDYLLSLLPGDDLNLSESMKQKVNALQDGELLQNVPNPFNGTTRIFYKLTNDAVVTVNVFDYTGKQIKTYTEGEKSSGVHSVVFDAKGLTSGMYFYSIDVNGVRSDSKKIIVE